MAALDLASRSGKPFHLQLAGGEPTLEPRLIEELARKVRSVGMPATISVQTNGTLLTRPMAEMFRRWDISVGVSLDGPPEQHERLRGNYLETLLGLEHLERAGVGFGVTAVVCAENVSHLTSLAMLLSNFQNAHGIGLDLLVSRGKAAHNGPAMANASDLANAMVELVQTLTWINQRRKTPLVLRELDSLNNDKKVFCHSSNGSSLAVHPDGSLYPCGQTMGDPDLALGNIDRPDFEKINGLSCQKLTNDNCASCVLNGHCPGECPSRLKYNGQAGRELACAMLQGLAHAAHHHERSSPKIMEHCHASA